ncbi:MAG: stage III sporulation protein AE [Prevotella sp.]|nr:stage III sporulation protein AE [Alistipes senegalensis]MCM1357555.1 stage III sporulation protein AE [Prevotella sp.]MCM1473519.1 stage III sporulation protein AE [Muribaculaceae bacterium]
MKKIFSVFIWFIILIILVSPVESFAESSGSESEISRQIDEIMSDYDIGFNYEDIENLSFSGLLNIAKNLLTARISAPLKVMKTLVLVILFTAVMKNAGSGIFSGTSAGLYNMICVITAVTVIMPQLFTIYGSALTAIRRGGDFILVFVPVFAGITVMAGGITTAGIYNLLILGASELIVRLSGNFLIPVVSISTVLAVSGSVFPDISLNSIINLLKKLITWGMTVTMMLFTGFVSMKCTLGGKADGVASKAARFLISGAVPVVGGAVSDAYATVKSSFDVIHGTVGTMGVIAMIIIMLPPVIEVLVFRVVMWIGTAAAELFSTEPLVKLMKGIDSGLAVAQSVLVCYSVIFVLCTGILMKCFS